MCEKSEVFSSQIVFENSDLIGKYMKKIIPWIIGLIDYLCCGSCVLGKSNLNASVWSYFSKMPIFNGAGPVKPGPEVVIAAIDEKSIDALGRWPWPRKKLAQLVDKLVQHQVKVIGFDMVLSSPDESSGKNSLKKIKETLKENIEDGLLVDRVLDPIIQESDNDAILATALKKSRRSVLGFFFHFNSDGLEHLTPDELHGYFQNIKRTQFGGFLKVPGDIELSSVDFRTAYAVESNIPLLSENTRSQGFLSFDVEPDGSMRKLPIVVKYHDPISNKDYFFPPMSVRVLERYLRGALLFQVGEFGAEKVIFNGTQSIEVPINDKGEVLVNFLGGRETFPHISIADILDEESNLVPQGSLRDKIVLIGATATALGDTKVTPFDPILSWSGSSGNDYRQYFKKKITASAGMDDSS